MLCGVGGGSFTPRPNPEPDVQVSKHPALQLLLDCLHSVRRIALTSIVKLLTQNASTSCDTKQPAPLRHVLGFPQLGLLRELRHGNGSRARPSVASDLHRPPHFRCPG